jgi:excisionase family DNA binding protein
VRVDSRALDFYRFLQIPDRHVFDHSQATRRPAGRWVSISRAAAMLGVNQATLRQWSAAGKVRVYTTPGGHRRFLEDELAAMIEARPDAPPVPALAQVLVTVRERYEALARRRLAGAQWFASFDEPTLRRFRILGGSMLGLVSSYLTGGRRERERALTQGREVAVEYGAAAARLGLSLSEATEAFLLFRTPVLEGLNQWIHASELPARQVNELLRRVNTFMDQVLLSMTTAHERLRTADGEATR